MDDPDLAPVADDEPEPPTSDFDPRDLGCLCDSCDLKGKIPVPPELRPDSLVTVIAEAPGAHEEVEGRPLVGPSGRELDRAVRACGFSRNDLSVDNVILCRIPGKGIDQYARRLRRRNEKRELDGQPVLLHPLEACRAHVERTVAQSRALLVLGKTALGELTGARAGEATLSSQRGFPATIRGLPALATWHPAHVLRNRRWTEVFRSDVSKAFRVAAGKLQWTAPAMVFDPALSQLDAVLERLSRERLVACDTETEPAPGREFDCEHDVLRCLALGTRDLAVSVGFKSVPHQLAARGPTAWRAPPELARERIRNFFSRCIGSPSGPLLVMHNGNVYDRPVLERHRMPPPDYGHVLDTLPLSRNAWSELGHDLDFLASWYTDAPKHKGRAGKKVDHEAWESDEELARYCMTDCAVDLAVFDPLLHEVKRTEQQRVYRSDVQMQRFAVGAHRAGMRIDPDERARHEHRLLAVMDQAELTAHAAVEQTGLWRRADPINLASVPQVREFLYDDLGLPWQVEDEEDEDPTTKRDAMYELLQVAGLAPPAREFIEALLEYRSAFRSLSKDIRGLRPDVLDGRVHPHWGTMGVTGRPQSSDPNVSNVPDRKRDPDSLRSIYVAAPGCVLVACDKDAAELRTVTCLSGDEIWLDLFARKDRGEKIDLHKENASVFFDGKPARLIEPFERDYAKSLTYMYLYGGGAKRAMLNMRQVRDPATGNRPYATMTLKRAREARDKLLAAHPWLPRWWDRTVEEWRAARFLREPLLGRVRYFLDGEGGGRDDAGEKQRSELINFRAQCIIASQVSGSGAVGRVMDEVGWPWGGRLRGLGGAGLVHHGYDSLMVEVAEGEVDRAKAILEDAMACEHVINGHRMRFPGKAKAGRRWSELA